MGGFTPKPPLSPIFRPSKSLPPHFPAGQKSPHAYSAGQNFPLPLPIRPATRGEARRGVSQPPGPTPKVAWLGVTLL